MDRTRKGGNKGMSSKSPGEWQALSHEEKTRHEALFFSQGPIEGLLPGEKSRELFLRSNLPLQILSQIWQLVDVPHDNMLDAGEFTLALHLIQSQLRGRPVPSDLPPCLLPPQSPPRASGPRPAPATSVLRLPQMSRREYTAYGRLFETLEVDRLGVLKVSDARDVLLTSGVDLDLLARIWDVAEVDRDGKLSTDEFCIACHLCRLSKKGHMLAEGPINALALLPNKTPKADLDAKKQKVAELNTRKRGLMALKEKRRLEAKREAKRVHLWRERLKLLRIRHQVLRDMSGLESEQQRKHESGLDSMETTVGRMEVVADRLKKEHEVVRQETARTIVEEQKLSEEVKALQEEADSLRQRRKRNSLIKDLDPFHQLYEDRKEEKLTGIPMARKSYDIHIPFKHDPFDPADLEEGRWTSGEELFLRPNNNNTLVDNGNGGPWGQPVDPHIGELTQGFDDNFVEKWGQTTSPRTLSYPGLVASPNFLDNDDGAAGDFSFDDDLDPVFRTVSVTAGSDDESWFVLPEPELAGEDERLHYLENKLACVNDLISDLAAEGRQLEFRHSGDYVVAQQPTSPSLERQSKWDVLASRRRSTDAHTASASGARQRQPRSSSEPRRGGNRGDASSKNGDGDSTSSSSHPHRSNSERAKRRSANVGYLDPYPEEGATDEYDFKFPESDPDLDAELFFESKQQKFRKNKAAGGSKILFIKPTTEKLQSPVQSLRKKKEKSKGSSNASSRSNSLDSNKSKEHSVEVATQEERSEDLKKTAADVEEKTVGTELVSLSEQDSSKTNQDSSSRLVTEVKVSEVQCESDQSKDNTESQKDTVENIQKQEDLKAEVKDQNTTEVTRVTVEPQEETDQKVELVKETVKIEKDLVVEASVSFKEDTVSDVKVVDSDSTGASVESIDSDSKEEHSLKTQTENTVSEGEAQKSESPVHIVPTPEVVLREKKSDDQWREDRASKAQTWYRGQPVRASTVDVLISEETSEAPRVRSPQKDQISKEFRREKAQSWCASGPTPVPPPRRKSRSPKKFTSQEELNREEGEKILKPNRSFLHSQSVELSHEPKPVQRPEIKRSLLSSSAPIVIKTKSITGSSASSTSSLSPIRSPKKRQAPKPPESSSSTSPFSSVPTSPVNRPIKAIHSLGSLKQTTKGNRSTLASTSSDGSRPPSPDLSKILGQPTCTSTPEESFPVAPPRTRSKRGKKGQSLGQTKGTVHSQTVGDQSDKDVPDQPALIRSHSLPAPDLVSDLTPRDCSETQKTDDILTHDAIGDASEIESTEQDNLKSDPIETVPTNTKGNNQSFSISDQDSEEKIESVTEDSKENTSTQSVEHEAETISVKSTTAHDSVNVAREGEAKPSKVDIVQTEEPQRTASKPESHDYVNLPPVDITGEPHPIKHSVAPSSSNLSHGYVNVADIAADITLPTGPLQPIKSTEPHEYVNVSSVAPPPSQSPQPIKDSEPHEYVNVSSLHPPPPESPKPIKDSEPHDYVNVCSLKPSELVGKPKEVDCDSEKDLSKSEEDQIYFPFEQFATIDYSHSQASSSESDLNSGDIVTPQGARADDILAWMKTENIVDQGSSRVEGDIVTRDGQPYEISVDYNQLSADDISLLVEHGFDYEIMDAAARKRELDRLRAQFFKPKQKDASPDSPSSSPVTSPTNNNNNSSSSAPQAKTVIMIGGDDDDDDYKSPVHVQDGISSSDKPAKYITNHTTTINVTNESNGDANKNPVTAFSTPLESESQVTAKNANSSTTDTSAATVAGDWSGDRPGAHQSKIILDLDEHQFVPEIETESSAPHVQSVPIESDPEDEDEIVIARTDSENSKPGLVAVSDPFDPWNFGTSSANKPGLYKEDSWDEPVDSKKDSGFGELSWRSEKDKVKEDKDNKDKDILDTPLVDFNQEEVKTDEKMASKSGKSPVAHAFGSPIYAGNKPPRDRSPKKSPSKEDKDSAVSITKTQAASPQKASGVTITSSSDNSSPVKTSNGVFTDFDQLASSAPLVHLDFGSEKQEDMSATMAASPPLPATPPPSMVTSQNALFDLDPFFTSPTASTEATPSGQSEKQQQSFGFGGSPVGSTTNTTTGGKGGEFSQQFEVSWDKQQQQQQKEDSSKTSAKKDNTRVVKDSVAVSQGARPKQTSPVEKKATSPDRKAEKKTASPGQQTTSPDRKTTSPDRKETTEDSTDYSTPSYVYKKSVSKENASSFPPPTSPTSPTTPARKSVTTTTIRLSSPERPLSPSADDLALLDVMDPMTGLRRTNPPTAVEKALQFIGSTETEPTYQQLKLRINDQPNDDIEKGRQEILGESRVMKKTVTSWCPDDENGKEVPDQLLQSKKRYEERRRSKDLHSPPPTDKKPNYNYNPADIDSRSITDQKQQLKLQIEQNLSSENARLFPSPPPPATQSSPKSPSSFRSAVDSDSIGDLNSTRKQLERMVSAEDGDNKSGKNKKQSAESEIDRDIRDAIERDRIFREEQKKRLQELQHQHQQQQQQQEKQDQSKKETTVTMPIQKVPVPVQKSYQPPAQKAPTPQSPITLVHQQDWGIGVDGRGEGGKVGSSWEMTEVDRDAARMKESIIERELREQRERERALAQQGLIKSKSYDEKEQEQSAFEQQEKEQEREAGESVIVREIRLQQEREQELRHLRESITSDSSPSQQKQQQQVPSQPEPAKQSVKAAPAPVVKSTPTKPVEPPSKQQPPASSPRNNNNSMAKPIGYEAAISTFAHAGENLIAKEIAEQKAREDAVRQHWKDRGMDVPMASQEPADTPFNRPDPHPAMNRGGRGGLPRGGTGTYVKEVKPYKANDGASGTAQGRRGSVESEDSSKASSGDRLDRGGPAQPKVQPYVEEDEDEDAMDNRRIFFQPQNETPVEREIRLAKERDMALQLERGLPVHQDHADGGGSGGSVEVTRPRPSSHQPSQRAAGDDKHAMKRFAASRLHFEMQREKQRELQMKGEGKISTTSEDRNVGQIRYKDIMSPDAGPPVPRPAQSAPKSQITSEVRVLHNGLSPRAGEPVNSEVRRSMAAGEPVKSEVRRSVAAGEPVKSDGKRSVVAAIAGGLGGGQEASSMVESLIEQELRLQREREEDLRRERERAITGRVVTNGDSAPAPASPTPSSSSTSSVPPPKSQSMDAIVKHREKQANDAMKTHRRKSALAEQWEKKFGATS